MPNAAVDIAIGNSKEELMEYNTEDVEKYILLGYNPKKNRSVEKNILYSGHWGCFWALIIWVIFHIIAIFGDYPIRVLPVNTFIILLTPIVVLIAIKFNESSLNSYVNKPHKKANPCILLFSTVGAVSGVIFARVFLSSAAHSTNTIILSVIIAFLILIFIFTSCISYYKIYLIRKFCPHLKIRMQND